MSDEFENMLKTLPLKQPSSELDDKIEAIISNPAAHSPKPVEFNFARFLTYAVAALLFVAIGVTEIVRRSSDAPASIVDKTPADNKTKPVKADSAIRVSTSESSDDFMKGKVIEMEDGSLVRPVIRQKVIKKIYYDSETNTRVVVEEPQNEIYYVPVQVD